MGDSTGVSASLGGEIFSRGKKVRKSNIGDSDNTGDGVKIVGEAIGACELGDQVNLERWQGMVRARAAMSDKDGLLGVQGEEVAFYLVSKVLKGEFTKLELNVRKLFLVSFDFNTMIEFNYKSRTYGFIKSEKRLEAYNLKEWKHIVFSDERWSNDSSFMEETFFKGAVRLPKFFTHLSSMMDSRKVEESLNVTFDETPPPSKTSPLVDDDLDEDEAIKVTEKKNLKNDIVDETLEIDKIVNIKESRNHPLENLVPQPRNMTIIGTKLVFRNKLDENGIVSRNKAKLVAQGYSQQEGIDYDEIYASVARLESIRILLAYACALDFKLFQRMLKSTWSETSKKICEVFTTASTQLVLLVNISAADEL
ncbi:retrovirus-related pol polyprotein from transposon TNT 1-94 [Tanacetum coccineum]